MIRSRLYIDDEIHLRLTRLARQQGCTLSELVRAALIRVYGSGTDEQLRTLRGIEGLWRDRETLDPEGYVRRLRRDTRRAPPPR